MKSVYGPTIQKSNFVERFPERVQGAPAAQGNFPGHIPQFAMGPGGFPPGFV